MYDDVTYTYPFTQRIEAVGFEKLFFLRKRDLFIRQIAQKRAIYTPKPIDKPEIIIN